MSDTVITPDQEAALKVQFATPARAAVQRAIVYYMRQILKNGERPSAYFHEDIVNLASMAPEVTALFKVLNDDGAEVLVECINNFAGFYGDVVFETLLQRLDIDGKFADDTYEWVR